MCSGGVETQNDLKGGKAERAGCMPASHVKKNPLPFPHLFLRLSKPNENLQLFLGHYLPPGLINCLHSRSPPIFI